MNKFDHLVHRCRSLSASNDDAGPIESRIVTQRIQCERRRLAREASQSQVVRMEWAPPEKREHPVGVAILAVLGLCFGCIVGFML